MIEIQLSDDDRLDWALKSFKKKVQKTYGEDKAESEY